MFSFLTVAWIRETDSLNFFFARNGRATCKLSFLLRWIYLCSQKTFVKVPLMRKSFNKPSLKNDLEKVSMRLKNWVQLPEYV